MANAKITALDANTAPIKTDILPIVDDPGGTPVTEKITLDDLLTVVSALTELAAAPDPTADDILIVDNAADAKYINVTNLLKVVSALTELAAGPDPTADDILVIDGATTPKYINVTNLLKVIDGLTELAEAPAATDTLVVVDAGTPKKVQFSNLGIGGGGQARKSLPIAGCYLPDDSANNLAAQIQHKTSSGGTFHPAWKEAVFDDTAIESILFCFLVPDNYASAPYADIYYKMVSATADDVRWSVSIMAVTDADAQDVDADAFDTANAANFTVPGTTGYLDVASIALSNADSMAANDLMIMRVMRNGADAGDDATGDAEVPLVVLRYTST